MARTQAAMACHHDGQVTIAAQKTSARPTSAATRTASRDSAPAVAGRLPLIRSNTAFRTRPVTSGREWVAAQPSPPGTYRLIR